MKIWVNCIVNNEENFIWFAIMSVIDYVDKLLIWDTGSDDNTVEIIKSIKSNKIEFSEVGKVDKFEFTKLRQKMLEESKCDWILILDGDEVWWDKSIKEMVNEINQRGDKIEGIVVPMVVSVGDIYHIQGEEAGKYKLLGRKGHLSLRAINKRIPGLHLELPYGKEGFFDKNNKPVQERDGIIYKDAPYLHLTHLKRSSKNRSPDKYKYEIGEKLPVGFKFPESFYKDFPDKVLSPWKRMSKIEYALATFLTPLRKIKRSISK